MFKVTYTANQIADRVKRTFGDESGVQVTDTDIIGWINSAQLEICSKNDVLKGTATTTSVANTYTYPTLDAEDSNIHNIHSITYAGTKLKYVSFQDFEKYVGENDPNRTSRATPEFWTEWGGQIQVYPTPVASGDTITVYFTRLPTPVTSLNDLLSLPDNYFNRILEYCLSAAYEMDENFGAHQAKMEQFDTRMLNMVDEDNRPADDFYPVVTVREMDMY